jgi:hypothetical protein
VGFRLNPMRGKLIRVPPGPVVSLSLISPPPGVDSG